MPPVRSPSIAYHVTPFGDALARLDDAAPVDDDGCLHRVEGGELVVEDGVIAYVAAIAAKNSGDARQAIRLLREAGDLASRSESAAVVTDDIAEAAKAELEASRVERAVSDLPLQTKLATLTLARRTKTGRGPIRTAALHDTYCQIARANGVERRSHDAFRDQLDDLDMLGIAIRHRHNEGRGGGIYYTWESDVAYDVVDTVLGELDVPASI